jgi:hypothetical protein
MSEQPSRGTNPELEKLIAECQSAQQIRDTVHNYWEKLGVKSDPTHQGLMWPSAVPQLSRIVTLPSGRRVLVEATSEADLDKGERIARESRS